MTRSPRQILVLLARILLGALFVYAGIVKIAEPTRFAGTIAAYRILPYFGNYLMAATLPWVELFSGTLLVLGLRTRGAATLVIVLNLVFMAALASAIFRGLDIDCGCFRQTAAKTSAWQALGRDTVLLAMALFVRHRSVRS